MIGLNHLWIGCFDINWFWNLFLDFVDQMDNLWLFLWLLVCRTLYFDDGIKQTIDFLQLVADIGIDIESKGYASHFFHVLFWHVSLDLLLMSDTDIYCIYDPYYCCELYWCVPLDYLIEKSSNYILSTQNSLFFDLPMLL